MIYIGKKITFCILQNVCEVQFCFTFAFKVYKKCQNSPRFFFHKTNNGIKTQNFTLFSYLLTSALIRKQEKKCGKVEILKIHIVIWLYFLRGIFKVGINKFEKA
jgi:hypothetical protein